MLRLRFFLVMAWLPMLTACTMRMPMAERSRPVVNPSPPVPLPKPPKPPRIYHLSHLDTLAVHPRQVLTLFPASRTAYDALPSPEWLKPTQAEESDELDVDPEKEERQRLRHADPAVHRTGHTLWLRPSAGRPLRLVTNPTEDYDHNIVYEYVATLPSIRQWLIAVHLYEGGYYLLIDQRTGHQTQVWSPPAVAPNGQHFVCGNSDVLARYEPNGLQVWAADSSPLRLLWERETEWGVSEPRWLDNRTILFQQDFFDKDDVDTRVMRLTVVP